ncbi:HEAT repeat-containing protein 6-like [Asterias amurensis]|uniref:HEAT repeat-containing protein 6-like n=1 Tax=Asterias amurensis TaxID=7602 RepID=UPI003AB5CCE2
MASSGADFAMEERQRYRHCASRLLGMVAESGEKHKNELNSLLDELNSLAYSVQGLVEQEPGRLLSQACMLVPLQEELLVTKVCQLIVIITHQKVVLSKATVETLLEYITNAMRQCQPWTLPETLRALGAVVYENGPKCSQFLKLLLGTSPQGVLLLLVNSKEDDVKRAAVQCIGNLCMRDDVGDVIDTEYLQTSYNTIITVLQSPKQPGTDDYGHFRLLLSTLRGLQNVLAATKEVHHQQLGSILASLKAYMLYGLPGVGTNFTIPPTIYPSPLYQHDSGPSPSKPTDPAPSRTPKEAAPTTAKQKSPESKKEEEEEEFSLRPGGGGGSGLRFTQPKPQQGKRGKKKGKGRQEKGAATPKKGRDGGRFASMDGTESPNVASATPTDVGRSMTGQNPYDVDPSSLFPAWGRVSSSESEYSDTEGGQASKLRAAASKVRQAALACLHCVIKNTEKKYIFGYWSAFIPDTPPSAGSMHTFSLFTSMLKDPAPKARVGSVVVLSALLDGSRQFLAAADDRDMKRRSAFTPFSHTLAATIKEMHRCVLLALMAESFSTTLTQIIKCLSILVQNVPYHKLNPGLLTKIVKGIRPYFSHKDNNVRTACLTCMGAVLSTTMPLKEISDLLLSPDFLKVPPVPSLSSSQTGINASSWRLQLGAERNIKDSPRDEDGVEGPTVKGEGLMSREDGDVSSDGVRLTSVDAVASKSEEYTINSGILAVEPNKTDPLTKESSIAMATDSLDSLTINEGASPRTAGCDDQPGDDLLEGVSVSWLMRWCTDAVLLREPLEVPVAGSMGVCRLLTPSEALPVRLEALQVMTQLVKGYFAVIRNILDHLCSIIISCLDEKDTSVQLHGLKVLEELGKVMLSQLNPELESPTIQLTVPLTPEEVVVIWESLLNGPLPGILQNTANVVLQSSACYCLSTIGPQCFELLKMDKRILCITMLLGLSNEEDYRVKAAAVRALGAYVLYPCLREDVMFVADTANSILTCLEDSSVNVRIRAAWSLGNLSDALIANKDAGDSTFLGSFSDMLLQKLFAAAIAGASDHDKVKSNAVRALGMLIRFARSQALAKSSIQAVVNDAIKALLKNITTGAAMRVKVRWNACYAMGNVFKNSSLEMGKASWSSDVFSALTDVVRDCKNFKVRINAALALSVPSKRCCYGGTDRFCLVWSSLLHALEVIDQVADVSELKYKDTLRDQLCQTLAHLGSLVTVDDLSPLRKILQNRAGMLELNILRYREAKVIAGTTDDKRGVLLSAASAHLQDMMEIKESTSEDRTCAAQLLQIFTVSEIEEQQPLLSDQCPM